MDSEIEFEAFSSGSEFEYAEGTCQNAEVCSSPSSDIRSCENGTFSSPEIEVFSSPITEKSTPNSFRCEVFSSGSTLAPTSQKPCVIHQEADSSLVLSSGAECRTSKKRGLARPSPALIRGKTKRKTLQKKTIRICFSGCELTTQFVNKQLFKETDDQVSHGPNQQQSCEAENDLKSSFPSSKHKDYIQQSQSQSPTAAARKAEESLTGMHMFICIFSKP